MSSMTVDDFRTFFIFRTTSAVSLTLESFSVRLRERDPEAFTRIWRSDLTGTDSLSFSFHHDDADHDGLLSLDDPPTVGVKYVTAAEAAVFAAWLRNAVLEPNTPVDFTVEQALEMEMPWQPLPTTPRQIHDALTSFAQAVLDTGGS
ncbi:hypothetical protein GCM10010406_35170 [Streptomyces thermolineatus]|uniref:Uncharacterized protein n=1 Tax=Streptomyces thermolineatus TaxID=44033 RepID=A0ABP5ZGD3_9ACTN